MKSIVFKLFLGICLATFSVFAADDAKNAAGTWKWSFAGQNGDTIDSVLKLKQDGEKLTGSYTNRFGEAEITEGKIKDGELSFKVKREFNGNAFVIKYSGKLLGNTIKGKSEFEINGETRDREWEAKRASDKSAAAGTWNTALILGDGNRIEGQLKLKADGEKLTGAIVRNENETQIQDGKVSGDEISFKTTRERDGRTVTAKYKGKISGDNVKGKVESDWSGDWQTLEWEGTRGK